MIKVYYNPRRNLIITFEKDEDGSSMRFLCEYKFSDSKLDRIHLLGPEANGYVEIGVL